MTDWTQNRIPWGMLTAEEQAEFLATGGPFECFNVLYDQWLPVDETYIGGKFGHYIYRLSPTGPEKPMVGLFSTLSDDQKRFALAFKGNHNFGASEHRMSGLRFVEDADGAHLVMCGDEMIGQLNPPVVGGD